MSNSLPVNIPKPPEKPDINEMHKWMNSIYLFLGQNFGTGTQSTFISQSQLNEMVTRNDLRQAGKVFINHDTGELTGTNVVAGTLTLKVL